MQLNNWKEKVFWPLVQLLWSSFRILKWLLEKLVLRAKRQGTERLGPRSRGKTQRIKRRFDMRKFLLPLFLIAAIFIAACGPTAAATPTAPVVNNDDAMNTLVANAVQTAFAATAKVEEGQAEEPAPTETPALPATGTPLPTDTPAPVGPQLRTAEDIRALGKVLGWVTGGNGEFVAGAQLELKHDVPLLDILQDGVVYEFQCVHYLQINGEVHAKPVCEGGLVRFSSTSVLPKGAIGTLWLPWAVQGSPTEEWAEGFLNAPCLCADGDCRDE
jgi:hypothetical protein